MAFLNIRPFDCISYGSEFKPEHKTDIRRYSSGYEKRLAIWDDFVHTYNLSQLHLGEEVETVYNTFMVCKGRIHTFLFKDWNDYRTGSNFTAPAFTDEVIGVGDGVETQFQMLKNYTVAATTFQKNLTRIVSSTTVAGVGGVEKTEGADWSVDLDTGIVTFTSAPAALASVTIGCEFNRVVRFDTDVFTVTHEFYDAVTTNVTLKEMRA